MSEARRYQAVFPEAALPAYLRLKACPRQQRWRAMLDLERALREYLPRHVVTGKDNVVPVAWAVWTFGLGRAPMIRVAPDDTEWGIRTIHGASS